MRMWLLLISISEEDRAKIILARLIKLGRSKIVEISQQVKFLNSRLCNQ